MQFNVPTPCTVKRAMDDYLCHSFHKRLRIDGPGSEPCPVAPSAAAVPPSPYGDMNSFLRGLHTEQLERRPRSAVVAMAAEDESGPEAAAAEALALGLQQPQGFGLHWAGAGAAMTSFSLPDVVRCNHGPGGRCLQCAGRLVQNVPIPIYSAFCTAYPASSSSMPSSSSAWMPRVRCSATELSFPACASLVACLAPEPGEKLLHLGSGIGRLVAVWVLLVSQGAACGIEVCAELHQEAVASAMRLPQSIHARIFLHCGDIFGVQDEWRQATTIFVSTAGFDESTISRLADGLQEVAEGTRVVALVRPLCADPNRAPTGFFFVRQAAYCTGGTGNCSVYIYRKCGPP